MKFYNEAFKLLLLIDECLMPSSRLSTKLENQYDIPSNLKIEWSDVYRESTFSVAIGFFLQLSSKFFCCRSY